MSFSGAVKLADLSDYLAPSQSCIVTAPVSKPTDKINETNDKQSKRPVVSLELDSSNDINDRSLNAALPSGANFGQIKIKQNSTDNQSAGISLTDCLACSGCVTSAETILIEAQSWKQVALQLQALTQSDDQSIKPIIVLSISPQSLASLVHHLRSVYHPVDQSINQSETQSHDQSINRTIERRLIAFLRHMGFSSVYDCGEALNLAIEQASIEFINRYRHNQSINQSTIQSTDQPFPLLCSECPGWVCYAEKTQGEYILPHLSEMTSPQQIVGRYVKMKLLTNQSINQPIIHVSVQPCFDKKLEASRPDAVIDALMHQSTDQAKECDFVISTNEMLEMMEEWGETARLKEGADECEFDSLASINQSINQSTNQITHPSVRVIDHGASGGYADHIFVRAAAELFDVHISVESLNQSINQSINQSSQEVVVLSSQSTNQPITSPYWQVSTRSSDLRELTLSISQSTNQLTSASNQPLAVLRFARMYGFRHLQSLVKSIKQANNQSINQSIIQSRANPFYHYVEVMACPSGCVNGGGQIKPIINQSIKQSKQRLNEILDIYHQQEQSIDASNNISINSPFVKEAHQLWDNQSINQSINHSNDQLIDQLKTKFFAVKPSDINPLTIKW